jgi:hypothetical protein
VIRGLIAAREVALRRRPDGNGRSGALADQGRAECRTRCGGAANGMDGRDEHAEIATREAWEHVLHGFREALDIGALPVDQRVVMEECVRFCEQLAGLLPPGVF